MFSKEDALLVIDYYEGYTRAKNCPWGKLRGSHKYSDKQLIAIALKIQKELGTKWNDWYTEIKILERINKIKARISSYDVNYINSPYYRYKTPRLPLPPGYKETINELKNELNTLNLRLEKRRQNASRVSRRSSRQNEKIYA